MAAPCHFSDGAEREFNRLRDLVRASYEGCGEDHAIGVAIDLAGLTHDPAVLLREACGFVHSYAVAAVADRRRIRAAVDDLKYRFERGEFTNKP